MKNNRNSILLFTVLLISMPALTANANVVEDYGVAIRGSISATTDYRERGLSTTGNRPTVYGNVELLHRSGVFLNTEVRGIKREQFPGSDGYQVQLVGGFRWGDPDAWHFEVGSQYSLFPGAKQPGVESIELIFDPDTGEVVDLIPKENFSSPNTTELYGTVKYNKLYLTLFHTVSDDNNGINSYVVCSSIEDIEASIDCIQDGIKHSKSSQYYEVGYTHIFNKKSSINIKGGIQKINNFEDFDVKNLTIEYLHKWHSVGLTLAAVLTDAKNSELYEVNFSQSDVRDTSKNTVTASINYVF